MAERENGGVQAPPDWRDAIKDGLDKGFQAGYFTRRVVGVGGKKRIYYDPARQFTEEVGFHQHSAMWDELTRTMSLVDNDGGKQEWMSLDGENVLRASGTNVTDPLGEARQLVKAVTGVELSLPKDASQVA